MIPTLQNNANTNTKNMTTKNIRLTKKNPKKQYKVMKLKIRPQARMHDASRSENPLPPAQKNRFEPRKSENARTAQSITKFLHRH